MAGGTNILAFILVSLVTFNFFAELGVNLLCAPALFRVIKVIDKNGVYGAIEMDSDNDFELKDNTEDNTDKE